MSTRSGTDAIQSIASRVAYDQRAISAADADAKRDAVNERIEILISDVLAQPHPDAAAMFCNICAPSDY